MNWIPSVNQFLDRVKSENDLKDIDKDIITRYIRNYLKKLKSDHICVERKKQAVLNHFISQTRFILTCPLKRVLNATGVLLHTNLGRAPISENAFDLLRANLTKYINIEFDLHTGKRAYRDDYLKDIFHFIAGSEDVVVVNNNAAALYLILKTYANSPKILMEGSGGGCQGSCCPRSATQAANEVIISRGELIEIGGSFRIPDILQDAGAVLREVGTTNCTRISDYEKAINSNTALILKAHTSNYKITGHTETTKIEDLVALSKKHNIPFVYDAGSGLIKKPNMLSSLSELTISECVEKGIDVVCFSGDKLLGSSQAGIILGSEKLLKPLKKNPLMRVLRADKLTICNLYHHISMYKNEEELLENNQVYATLSQSDESLKQKAFLLSNSLNEIGIKNKINEAYAHAGGGSLPELQLKSYEIMLDLSVMPVSEVCQSEIGATDWQTKEENIYHRLLNQETPILSILKERKLFLNIFAIDVEDIPFIVDCVKHSVSTQ